MGRKALYQPNQNIVVSEGTTAGWKVASCKICHKVGIRSNKWQEHLHENYQSDLGVDINIRFLESAGNNFLSCLQQRLWEYLIENAPLGISSDEGQKLNQYLLKGIVDLISYYSKPLKKLKSLQKTQVRSIMEQIVEEPIENQLNDNHISIEKASPLKTRKAKRIKKLGKQEICQSKKNDSKKGGFLKQTHTSTQKILQLKKNIDDYKMGDISVSVYTNGIKKGMDGGSGLYNLLKACYVCNMQFTSYRFTYYFCKLCHTRFHEQCFSKMEHCACERIRLRSRQKNPFIFQMQYDIPRGILQWYLLNEYDPNITTFNYSTLHRTVLQQERALIRQLKERDQLIYTRCALAPKDIFSVTNAMMDPLVACASSKFKQAYYEYESGKYMAPVRLIYLSSFEKEERVEVGIQALEDIPNSTLICQYAADILPSIYLGQIKLSEHVMLYANGKDGTTQLVLAPFNCANWSIFINHAPSSKSNCSSLRIIVDGIIRVVIYSTRKILKGQQLLYDYNGFFKEVDTRHYKDLQQLK